MILILERLLLKGMLPLFFQTHLRKKYDYCIGTNKAHHRQFMRAKQKEQLVTCVKERDTFTLTIGNMAGLVAQLLSVLKDCGLNLDSRNKVITFFLHGLTNCLP